MLRFPCPECNFLLSAPEEVSGRVSKCRQCGARVTVPAVPSGTDKPPSPKDKTSLGNVIGHTPTSIKKVEPPVPPAKKKKAPPTPSEKPASPSAKDKTSLGKVISHSPTSLHEGEPPASPPNKAASSQAKDKSPQKRPTIVTPTSWGAGKWIIAIGAIAIIMLVSASVLGWGAWHFFVAGNGVDKLESLPEKKVSTPDPTEPAPTKELSD
jgi:hypothetical protein